MTLHHFPIRADFAESVVYSWSNGNELEVGAACTSDAAAQRLKEKIDKKLEKPCRDLSLWLDEEEAMCLAVASQNCQTNGLPSYQIGLIESWHSKWCEWTQEVPG